MAISPSVFKVSDDFFRKQRITAANEDILSGKFMLWGDVPSVRAASSRISASLNSSIGKTRQNRAASSRAIPDGSFSRLLRAAVNCEAPRATSSDRTHNTISIDEWLAETHSTSRQDAESSHWLSSRTNTRDWSNHGKQVADEPHRGIAPMRALKMARVLVFGISIPKRHREGVAVLGLSDRSRRET